MYKHYETSDDVFVDREEYIKWMDDALDRCKDGNIILHLRGIGGIGKSSLLRYWNQSIETAVRLDCSQFSDYYSRLDTLAKGVVRIGIKLPRFDIIWHIRKRFVEGVEPAKETGREWAKDVLMAIPFIGSLASIGTAISSIGKQVAPKLKGKYGLVGKWLQECLGANYMEKLLEILWKDPRHAEFLFLDALLEDINNRKDLQRPLLFLLDHFEYVDQEELKWRYSGRKVSESELWYIFLSSLRNCVGVLSSRRSIPDTLDAKLKVEEKVLTELDESSIRELLDKRMVSNKDIQDRITSVTGGNPFVIDAICDMNDSGRIALNDVESLRADTLDEVRLKTWRRLFNMSKDLQDIINRAGLLQAFDRRLMDIIAPTVTTDIWDRLRRLSFVYSRDDGTWVLHDLARELIITELGSQGKNLVEEVAQLLEKKSREENDLGLIGQAFSVKALFSEEEVIEKTKKTIKDLIERDAAIESLQILDNTKFQSMKGKAELQGLRGRALGLAARFAEAEEALRDAIRINEELAEAEPEKHLGSVAEHLCSLSELFTPSRLDEALTTISRALEMQRGVAKQEDVNQLRSLARILLQFGVVSLNKNPLDAIDPMKEAIAIYRKINAVDQIAFSLNALSLALANLHRWTEAEQAIVEAMELQKRMIESQPDNLRLKSVLAAMTHNMAFMADFKGNKEEGERFYGDALQIRRNLADRDPDVYLQRLLTELWSLGIFYFRYSKLDEAEKLFLEVLEIAKGKAEKSPEEYEVWIERASLTLSQVYSIRGKTRLAISSINKAIDTNRRLVDKGGFSLRTATLTSSFAIIRIRMHEYEKAEKLLRESIRIYSDSGPLAPRWHADFAQVLNNYGTLLWREGRLSEAKAVLEEALGIIRGKVEELPEVYTGLLSTTLCNLAITLADYNESEAANSNFQESLSISEYLAKRTPDRYRIHRAIILHNFANFLLDVGKRLEAYGILRRAVEIKRGLVTEFPGIFESSLVASLRNLSVMLREDNEHGLEEVVREVFELCDKIPYLDSTDLPKDENWEMEWEANYAEYGETP
ncbi:MAG: hypothetical protein ACFFEA_12395 [Candidatus Thorarchaeota archaeon]